MKQAYNDRCLTYMYAICTDTQDENTCRLFLLLSIKIDWAFLRKRKILSKITNPADYTNFIEYVYLTLQGASRRSRSPTRSVSPSPRLRSRSRSRSASPSRRIRSRSVSPNRSRSPFSSGAW